MRHFHSLSLGVLVLFPVMLLYHSDTQAKTLYHKYSKVERQQQHNDFRDGVAIWQEWSFQVQYFEELKANFDVSIYKDESTMVDQIIQSKVFVQDKEPHFYMTLIRLHCIGVEYALANICLLKALKFELYGIHYNQPAQYKDRIKYYLQLGLAHITFTPQQDTMNQMFLFSNLHEKLLRAQLLMKLIAVCDDLTECRAMWTKALENLGYCTAVGQRNDFQAILLQAGIHMQDLSEINFPAERVAAGEGDVERDTMGEFDVPVPVAAGVGVGAADEGDTKPPVAQFAVLSDTEVLQRAGLRAQGAALQAHALQYLLEVNGKEVVEELLTRKINVQMPNVVNRKFL